MTASASGDAGDRAALGTIPHAAYSIQHAAFSMRHAAHVTWHSAYTGAACGDAGDRAALGAQCDGGAGRPGPMAFNSYERTSKNEILLIHRFIYLSMTY